VTLRKGESPGISGILRNSFHLHAPIRSHLLPDQNLMVLQSHLTWR
jgi:hypothetical protein